MRGFVVLVYFLLCCVFMLLFSHPGDFEIILVYSGEFAFHLRREEVCVNPYHYTKVRTKLKNKMIQSDDGAAAVDDDNSGGPAGPAPSAGPKELPWRGEIFDHCGKRLS